jgi:hypothetical protein
MTEFKGSKVKFEWTNAEWSAAFLPVIRHAVLALEKDEAELQQIVAELLPNIHQMLGGLLQTREHLQVLVDVLDAVLARHLIVLQKLGVVPILMPTIWEKLGVEASS